MNHQACYRPEYLRFLDNMIKFMNVKSLSNSYFMQLNMVASMKRIGLTPQRVSNVNSKITALQMKILNSLTAGRWDASRDGLHFHGYCKNTTLNACGGVVKAKALILLNSIVIDVLKRKDIDIQAFFSSNSMYKG